MNAGAAMLLKVSGVTLLPFALAAPVRPREVSARTRGLLRRWVLR